MKLLVLVMLVCMTFAKYIRQNHDYWYSAGKTAAAKNVAYLDYAWNYCDKKCLYLQNYVDKSSTFTFTVIDFKASALKADFSACYAKDNITGAYKLWRDVVSNSWFDKRCGADNEDWMVKYKEFKEVPAADVLSY